MGTGAFRDLAAYRQATALAKDVRSEAMRWGSFDKWSVGLQLVRAAESVGANIAEGVGRQHRADRRRLLFIARGSLYETEHWIPQATSRGLMDRDLRPNLLELARTLNGLIKWTEKGWR